LWRMRIEDHRAKSRDLVLEWTEMTLGEGLSRASDR
jgi:hypothetical protein